ncbi:hypothetical protein GCM10008023_40320 [Sphingomonas glacialis]|uniref:F5/8 type C domain-containing protein n=1 Tax=Sphingomonas glacialis TaxID=658225 RepID=A0ABQ3LWS3_9SPHN|nr:discoidin domain-containing protein [Sphingomonas glacialis]GHH26140.1 hypothetical protein GCM10008023_40320 [Sphingomonas glacialis]
MISFLSRAAIILLTPALVLSLSIAPPIAAAPHAARNRITVEGANAQPLAVFDADEALGASIDGGAKDEAAAVFRNVNLAAMRKSRFPRLAYRLRTELANEAWHWSSEGQWSDPAHNEGYWTGDASANTKGLVTFGYKLARRGNTIDQANDDGYSRLDDGDSSTFWKSNPYLDQHFSKETPGRPQWVVVELPKHMPIDAITIAWKQPFARRYAVQYWVGADEYEGRWHDFPQGVVSNGRGGTVTLNLAQAAISTKFVRVLLQQSSGISDAAGSDIRDRLGFAIGEIYLGTMNAGGSILDVIRHGTDRTHQTILHVSSTDPWHRAIDRDAETEQPSFEALIKAEIIQRTPIMVPAGLAYDTPDNALAELHYLQNHHIPFDRVELGEEPDGQMISAPDYSALYLEFARHLHASFPKITIGGPSLQDGIADTWLDPDPDESWTSQFVRYLTDHHGLDQLGFFSFELFPFDNLCGSIPEKLLGRDLVMDTLFKRLKKDGVPRSIPWVITEYGFSAFAGRAMVEMPSALLDADMIADFLGRGGSAAYLYGYPPDQLLDGDQNCSGRGNMMLWEMNDVGQARWAMPAFYAMRMMKTDWAGPGRNMLYRATTTLHDDRGRALIAAYPILRSDGQWSLLIINRSSTAVTTRVAFKSALPGRGGPLHIMQYSSKQYLWNAREGHPSLDRPPEETRAKGWDTPIPLPALSLTVLTGAGPVATMSK